MMSAIPIVRNSILRICIARGVIVADRMSKLGESAMSTSINGGVCINEAHNGAIAMVTAVSAAPIARFTVTTTPGILGVI